MPNKTLYIPDDEIPLWDAAQRVARLHKTSLYRVVAEALKNDLPRAAAEPPASTTDQWAHIAADAARDGAR